MLLILGGNPVYNAPSDLNFHAALLKVPNSIHLSLHANETSALTRWIIPQRHFLEDWGDARSFDGTVTILQPLLQPLYNGRSSLEMLDALLLPVPRPAYDILRAYWTANSKAADFEGWWRSALQSGRVAGSALPP